MSDFYNFNMDGTYQTLPMRPETRFPSRTPKTWNLVRSDHGVAPESIFASKFLPVQSIDDNTADAVVIPQGVIVALKNVFDSSLYATIGADTELGISGSGSITVGANQYGTALIYNTDDDMVAYGDYQPAVMTIANGGVAVDDVYTALDESWGKYGASGSAVSAGDTYQRAANIPFGVTKNQVFDDYRGKYLNSNGSGQQLDAPLIDSYIWVPYVIDDASETYKFTCTVAGTTQTKGAGYAAALPLSGFLYLQAARDGIADANVETAFVNGEYLVSDYNGRFLPQATSVSNALTEGKTAQTIGRLIHIDNKWPKDLSHLADTYEGSKQTGTDTRGVDRFLYLFVEAILRAAGVAYTRDAVYTAIKSGRFGMATIEILAA